ncbi:hypothetical protein Ddye_023982 [Dipteronia dyeriana]|uniref:Ubiquitin-like protease family profile domain-containing protein n=1 Tax=Dipteronia dyeriana TaxID=168575 RepID=A0AAD9TU09_9ROSI|nr:hypothetical protein Ddye_023982 [Dipteronia dyeriana]
MYNAPCLWYCSFVLFAHADKVCDVEVTGKNVMSTTSVVTTGLVLERECHVKNANVNTSSLWYHVGNGVIRFSPVEFCLNKFIDKLKDKVDGSVKRKVERYNVYGFVTAFQLTIYKNIGPSDEEARKPYWMGMDQLQYVSSNVDGYDDEDDDEDDVEDDADDTNHDDIEGDHSTKIFTQVEVGGKKKKLIKLHQLQKRMDVIQLQQNAFQDQMTYMQNSLMNEMQMGFLRLTELICLNKVAEKLNEENTIDVSQNENIHDYQPSVSSVVKSPEFVVMSETSEDVKQLTRPPKLTIKVHRDRKRSAFTVSPYIDPTVKRPRKLKMPEFGSISQVDDDIVRSMQSWINDNKNTCMYTGLLEAKPAWFELLLSKNGWLEGDMLFPTNVNGNHWVAVEVDLKERVIKVFDSMLDAYIVDEILKWATCLRKMLSSLLVHAMPNTYTDP